MGVARVGSNPTPLMEFLFFWSLIYLSSIATIGEDLGQVWLATFLRVGIVEQGPGLGQNAGPWFAGVSREGRLDQ